MIHDGLAVLDERPAFGVSRYIAIVQEKISGRGVDSAAGVGS